MSIRSCSDGVRSRGIHLIVKPAGTLEVIHVSGVRFTSPELHIRDFHVTPIYRVSVTGESHDIERATYSGSRCTLNHHRPK